VTADVDARATSTGATSSRNVACGPFASIAWSRKPVLSSATRSMSHAVEVSGGASRREIGWSPKPATATSSGIDNPSSLQAAYTLALKHLVLLDVLAIGGLFVLRAAAGAAAVDVRISPWLLLCTALLALFLALGKRRAELVLVGDESTPTRPALEGYTLALVDQLLAVVAAATVIAYSLYTFTARDSSALMVTIPFVLFGVFRYLLLLHRGSAGEEPENVLVRDTPILVCVAAWAVTCAAVLAVIGS